MSASLKAYLSVSLLLYTYVLQAEYSCTSVNLATCTIDRTTALNSNNRQNITCSSASNCNVQCNVENACSATIYCPPNGDLCIINCATAHACSDSNIITGDCQNVTLNINGNTQNMQITAPGNTGSLFITTAEETYFQQTKIYSSSTTNNMIINCNGDCSDNNIHATNMAGDLNISCIGDTTNDCDMNTIYCPKQCNIWCNNCADTSIISNNEGIDDINWICHEDCTNSSLSDREFTTQLSWHECASLWLLLASDLACPIVTTESDGGDDFDQQQFTILAFVLIGTVIGCLCVIVVTTIICCICWHEHQIKSLNPSNNNPNTNHNVHNLNVHNHNGAIPHNTTTNNNKYDNNTQHVQGTSHNTNNIANSKLNVESIGHMAVKERTPSIPESSAEPSPIQPVPTSISRPENFHNIIYHNSPKRHSKRSNNRNLNAIPQHYQQPQQQQNPSSSSSDANQVNQAHQTREKKQHSSRNSGNTSHTSSRKPSPEIHPFEQRAQRDKKQRGSRKTSTNSSQRGVSAQSNKSRRSYSSQTRKIKKQIQIEQQIANQQQQQYNNMQNNRHVQRKQKVSYNEEAEAADDLFPLQNDRIGQHYDTNGQYDIYANRKKNKDEIKMQLAAFPSNISAGTTGTAEMNFVGSNYNEYNPMVNNNSYFKEDGGSFEPTLSLGNLDSGATATTVTTVTTVASSVAMTTPTKTATSPDFNTTFKQQYQGHKFQGQRQQGQQKRREPIQPNEIKIMQPQNQGKVQHTQQQHKKQSDSSPTLTYSSPTAEY